MSIYNEIEKVKGTVPPRLTLGNIDGGGHVLKGKMRMFRMGQRLLSSYDYDTLDLTKLDKPEGSKHITIDEIQRFFDRAGKGRQGATITDPRMTTKAVVFITMEPDSRYPRSYYTRQYTDDAIAVIEHGYRSWGAQDVEQESVALIFKLTQLDSGREAYFDNSRFMISSILWEFSPDGGRGRWYQLYELPNQKVRVTLPEPTQQLRIRAISNSPDEWVQTIALTPRTDFQNRYAEGIHWVLDGESDNVDEYIEYDDLGYLMWPKAEGSHGDVIYTLYWTPDGTLGNAVQVARTKLNDLAPGEFQLPVNYLGGLLMIFAQDMLSTISAKFRFTRSLADCEVICNPSSYVYDGHEKEPEVTVRFKLDLAVLDPSYYSVEYVDNVDAGMATVIITGIGYYEGTPNDPGRFSIAARNISECSVELSQFEYEYDGSSHEPAVTVRIGDFVVSRDDYDVFYMDNVQAGTATARIVGKGNLFGEVTRQFEITRADLGQLILVPSSAVYAERWELPDWHVNDQLGEVVPPESVNVSFSPSEIVDVGDYVATAVAKPLTNYKGSSTATFTLERASILNCTIEDVPTQRYTGYEVKPRPEVTRRELGRDGQMHDRVLVAGVDYYYTWHDNVEVGTGRVIVTGMGNYEGCETFEGKTWDELFNECSWDDLKHRKWEDFIDGRIGRTEKLFEIEDVFSEVTIALDFDSATYTGSEIKPSVMVSSSATGEAMPAGDYSVIYSNNVNVGTATVRVVGNGVWADRLDETATFAIEPMPISTCTVELSQTTLTYDGTPQSPSVSLSLGGKTIDPSNYTVTYQNNVDAGTATVKVVGRVNYSGEVSRPFSITPAAVGGIALAYASAEYGDQWALPGYVVTGVGGNLDDDEYTVAISPSEITGAGDYVYTVTGKHNHAGTVTATFTLDKADMSTATIAAVPQQNVTGQAVTPEPAVTRGETARDGSPVNRTLQKGVDFDYSYSDNVNVGTATVTVTGKGNYEGSKSATFQVVSNALSRIELEYASGTYGEQWSLPSCSVYGSSGELDSSAYSLSVSPQSITGAGTYTFTATGRGLYSGTLSATFTLSKADISTASIAAVADVEYTGAAITPKPSVTRQEKDAGGASVTRTLVEGTDYDYAYESNVSPGVATVKAVGKGNYSGTASRTFAIVDSMLGASWDDTRGHSWQYVKDYTWGQLKG